MDSGEQEARDGAECNMKQNEDYRKRDQLIEVAKKEFLAKGYNKASLREICAKAGVTTGALYFFFENKADLFAAIVDEPLRGLKQLVTDHFREDREYLAEVDSLENIDMDHSEISDRLADYIYRYYDSFLLVLTAAENTVYEHCVDDYVKLMEDMVPYMMAEMTDPSYDAYMSHWMAHITIDAFTQVIKHEPDVKVAKVRLRNIMNYLVQGWVHLVMLQVPDRGGSEKIKPKQGEPERSKANKGESNKSKRDQSEPKKGKAKKSKPKKSKQ